MTADPLVNTASATDLASGMSTSASDSDALTLGVALAVTKSDGSATYTPGGSAVYTVVVTNAGPSNAASVTVSDVFPAGSRSPRPSAASRRAMPPAARDRRGGADGLQRHRRARGRRCGRCADVYGAGRLRGRSCTDPLVNTATAADARERQLRSASDSDARSVAVSLAVAKTDGSTTYMPGGTATYTVA